MLRFRKKLEGLVFKLNTYRQHDALKALQSKPFSELRDV
jgi:hypothetical protein